MLPAANAPRGAGCATEAVAGLDAGRPLVSSSTHAQERLFQIELANAGLAIELDRNAVRMAQARAYLARSDSNPTLGRARLRRLREHRSCLLTQLRANRLTIREILAFPYMQIRWTVEKSARSGK